MARGRREGTDRDSDNWPSAPRWTRQCVWAAVASRADTSVEHGPVTGTRPEQPHAGP